MNGIYGKQNELRDLIIGKSLAEQKEIIINFLNDNKKEFKPFKGFYKLAKKIFNSKSLSDKLIQEIINNTFILLVKMTYEDIENIEESL